MGKELCLTIPCEPAKGPDLVRPIYIYLGVDCTGAARCCYQCPHCGGRGPRALPIRKHMGMQMNIPASCPRLLAEDARRRTKL
jgi:hypothetical protein